MKRKIFGKIFTLIILIVLMLFTNKILTRESFGADEGEVIIEGSLDKYVNYDLQDQEQGTLVQYTLKVGIEYGDNYTPVKNSELTVNLNQIDGKFPYDAKVIAISTKVTNGKTKDLTQEYDYDSSNGTLKIIVNNENENSEPINNARINQEDRDIYVVIGYYDTYSAENPERDLSYDVAYKAVMFTEDDKEITDQQRLENKVTENIGELTSINSSIDEIYNGYMKSNITNGTSYDTQYKENQDIMISKKDVQQKIVITEDNEFVNINDIQYKSTKILKEDIVNLLGENGKIEIFDGNNNVIVTVDNATEFNENGEVIITYPENTNKILLKTSNIENVGILHIENEKAIKADISSLEDVDIKTKVEVRGINEEEIIEGEIVEKEIYKVEKENLIEIKNADTNVEMNLDNTQWTNGKQNEVTFDIILNSTSIRNNLFENPTLKIELPSQVEKVILENTSIVYANGLTLDNVYVETSTDGRISIIANLGGKQIQYSENDLGLTTNVKISAVIILEKDIESTQDKVNLVYTNDYNNKEQGNIEKEISIENYVEVQNEQNIAENNSNILEKGDNLIATITEAVEKNAEKSVREITAEEIEGLKVEIQPIRGDTNLKDGDIVYEGEYIKYNVKITNTLDKDVEDIKIVGTIPEGVTYGELNADYYSYGGVYEYEFDENLTQKEIEIGTLQAGQSIEQFYEVRVDDLGENEEEKQIVSNIKAYVGSTEITNYDLNNVVKSTQVKAFLSASLDNLRDRWNYDVTIENPDGKEVIVKLYPPKEFELQLVIYNGFSLGQDEVTIGEDSSISITVTSEGQYSFQGIIDSEKVRQEDDSGKIELKSYVTLETEGNTYRSNENRIIYEFESVSVKMTSDNEGEEVNYSEEINYQISITNTGRTNLNDTAYNTVSINILDYLPEYVVPVSVTYEYYEINQETGEVSTVKNEITEDITGTLIDENGNKLPNVDIGITIPYGETVNITIKTTAGYVYEETQIENSVIVRGDRINTRVSNVITHTILPYNTASIEEPEVPEEPEDPDNPSDPDSPDNPEDPGQDVQEYSISGIAWNDKNGDGQRQEDERTLLGITVMLVDMDESNKVKESVTTTSNGSYVFSNLERGNYIVVFRYDASLYTITEYKKNGVSSNLNSDATNQEITLNGERINAGVTDVINLSNDESNIDIGLIENNSYNLKLDKYVSSVIVNTNTGSKQYSYNDSKLAKIEIKAKEMEGANITVKYSIVITNNGDVATAVNEIFDYLPEGLSFSAEKNRDWTLEANNKLVNRSFMNQKIEPGESRTTILTLTKQMTSESTGAFTNRAEIGDVNIESNNSQADIIISISTGLAVYISFGVLIFAIIVVIVFLLFRFGIIKVGKIGLFALVFVVITLTQATSVFAIPEITTFQNVRACENGHTITGVGDYDVVYCPYCGARMYQTPDFAEGPDGAGGYCVNRGQWAHSGTHYYHSEEISSSQLTNSEADVNITLTRLNDQIGMRKLDSNYILGPFQVSASYNAGYSYEIYDLKGNMINTYITCNENGENITVTGTATFYLKIPEYSMENGVSRVRISMTRTGTMTIGMSYWGHIIYDPGYGMQQVRTNSIFYLDNISDSTTQLVTNTQYVEWTNFNASLEIIKQDADNSDVKLSGVEINVRCDYWGYNRTFTTDANGRIHIDNLATGSYQLTEISNANYGYERLESDGVYVYPGTVVEYSLTNEKQTGNLQIIKKDADSGDSLENVVFNLRNSGGLYVVGIDEGGNEIREVKGEVYLSRMQTTSNESRATQFITDSNGEINVYNILIGTYTVKEVSVGDNNYGYDIDDNYISWETGGRTGQGSTATIEVTRQRSYETVSDSNIIVDNQKVIEDGVYEIQSNVGANKVIEVTGAYTYDGANVALYDRNKTAAQKFYIRYLGRGYYSIISLSSNKYVEVAGASTSPGANVQIYEGNGTDAQIWKIQYEGNGNYSLVSKCNGLYMDIYNAETANGTNVQVYVGNNSNAQRYRLNDLTGISSATNSEFSTVTYNNKRKYISLSGNVWEDIQWERGKNETINQLYHDVRDDIKDQLLENVTVKLKDRRGNSIAFKDKNGNLVRGGEILTDENGYYFMQDVLIDQLGNYYIEFSYNGMAYENVDLIDINKTNGTHAIEADNRTEYNESFARITYQGNSNSGSVNMSYSGQSNNSNGVKINDILYDQSEYESNINYEGNYLYGYYKSTEAEYNNIFTTREEYETYYPINGVAEKYLISATTRNAYASVGGTGYLIDVMTPEEIRRNGITEIDEGLDLGLKKRERPDLSVIKDLKSASVRINGQTRVYEYDDRFNESGKFGNKSGYDIENLDDKFNDVGVAFEEKYASMSYTRALYASDIMYDDSDNSKNLEVRVTYKIGVRNSATGLNAKVYELQDYFDSKYDLVGVGLDINDDGSIREGTEIEGVTATTYSDDYKTMTIKYSGEREGEELLTLEPLTDGYVYVELRVLPENLIDVVSIGQEIKLDNITEITGYGTTKTVGTRSNGTLIEEIYAGIDRDSQPGNLNVNDRTTWEDDTDKAPGLKIILQDARTVSGQVFEDDVENQVLQGQSTDAGQVRQGNGHYDEGEKGIENVEVRLVNTETNSIQQIWTNDRWTDAITYTDSDGNYTFEGFIPGNYKIEYVWGNNTYRVQDYKSTIVGQEVWEAKEENDQWYKEDFKQIQEWNVETNSEIRNSDAVDNYEVRLNIDGTTNTVTYGSKQDLDEAYTAEDENMTKMTSSTPIFKINIEYNTNTSNVRDEYETDENGILIVDEHGQIIPKNNFKNNIENVDFGIVERSRQILQLSKYISTARIVLADGNVLVNAKLNENGELEDFARYVTVVPRSTVNGYLTIEVDQELIQGATLEIEYGLKISNISEVEYQTQEFYMYGRGYGEDDNKLVTLQPALIIDYLDKNMATDIDNDNVWDYVEKSQLDNLIYNEKVLSEDIEGILDTSKILTTDSLENVVLKPIGEERDKTVEVILEGYKLLSSNDEAFFENNAEIITVIKNNGGASLVTTPGNYVPNKLDTYEEDNDMSQSVTIIPPTGLISDYVAYITLSVSSLGILISGIILIKKYVLTKNR